MYMCVCHVCVRMCVCEREKEREREVYARVCVHARVRTRVLTCTLYHRWLHGVLPVHSEDHDRSATVKTPSQWTKRAAPFVHLPSSSHPELLSVLGLFFFLFFFLLLLFCGVHARCPDEVRRKASLQTQSHVFGRL